MTHLMPVAWFTKDPSSVLDYNIDWSDLLGTEDTILSSTWIVSGLTVVSDSFTDTMTTAIISGGTANSIYQVINMITSVGGLTDSRVIEINVHEDTPIHLLLKDLRLHLGDIDPTAYRYLDKWLMTALVAAIKALQKWWNFKYLVNSSNEDIYRNPSVAFMYTDPPLIEDQDHRAIVLMASIIIKKGQLENVSWNLGSWRDAEISVSNIEGGKTKTFSIKDDWEELKSIIKPPQNKLAQSRKTVLPGYFMSES